MHHPHNQGKLSHKNIGADNLLIITPLLWHFQLHSPHHS